MRFIVETRRPPPNHDCITGTFCETLDEAIAMAQRVKGSIWLAKDNGHTRVFLVGPTELSAITVKEEMTVK